MKQENENHYHPQMWKADFLEPVKDQWDAIEKLSKSNQSHYSAVAILDSIMEHGFCEEIHPRMINQFFKEYAGEIHPTEYKHGTKTKTIILIFALVLGFICLIAYA